MYEHPFGRHGAGATTPRVARRTRLRVILAGVVTGLLILLTLVVAVALLLEALLY